MSSSTKPKHARYGASKASMWGQCAGAMTLAADSHAKDTPSRYAAEGTLGHTLAARSLTEGTDPSVYVGNPYREDGFAFIVEHDFAEHIRTYVDNIREYAGDTKPLVEVEVSYASAIGVKPEEGFGTADVIILFPNELQVHDLKMGQGEVVDAEDNWQLKMYALGAYLEYGDMLDYGDDTKVTLVIHQPRVRSAPSEWSCTVADIVAFGAKMKLAVHLEKAAIWGHAAYRNDGRKPEGFKAWVDRYLVPGEKQCRWCSAKATCPAVREIVTKTVYNATPVDADEFRTMTFVPKAHVSAADNDWLSSAMKQAPLIRDWLKAVATEIDRRVLEGQHVDGFKVIMGDQGDRKWESEEAAEKEMKSMRLKLDDMYNKKLISPTLAEKMSKGKDPVLGERQWTRLSKLIVRAPGAPRVAPDDHPGKAIEVKPVDEEFDDVSQDAPLVEGNDAQSLADEIG